MKALCCLAMLFLCACESLPLKLTEGTNQTSSVVGCTDDCLDESEPLTFSSQPCHLANWQTFINWVQTSTEEERQNRINVLDMRFPPDQIKNLILVAASNASLPTISAAHQKLTIKAGSLNSPLKAMLLGYILQNEQKRKLTETNQIIRQENEALKKNEALLINQIRQLQKKIDALTKIEQQINDSSPKVDRPEAPDYD